MKTLLVATISVILILIMGWRDKEPTIQEQVEVQLKESQALHDSAIVCLKEIRKINDSLMNK